MNTKVSAQFSPSGLAFYSQDMIDDGSYGNELPADLTELTDDELGQYWKQMPPSEKRLGAVAGRPAWVDVPPPTPEEYIAQAENQKTMLINEANAYINSKQWPGKAAMGRLKDSEKTQYNAWLDYLDELEAVDTSTAPDITWPVVPE